MPDTEPRLTAADIVNMMTNLTPEDRACLLAHLDAAIKSK
jgi:hypothetical protein